MTLKLFIAIILTVIALEIAAVLFMAYRSGDHEDSSIIDQNHREKQAIKMPTNLKK